MVTYGKTLWPGHKFHKVYNLPHSSDLLCWRRLCRVCLNRTVRCFVVDNCLLIQYRSVCPCVENMLAGNSVHLCRDLVGVESLSEAHSAPLPFDASEPRFVLVNTSRRLSLRSWQTFLTTKGHLNMRGPGLTSVWNSLCRISLLVHCIQSVIITKI